MDTSGLGSVSVEGVEVIGVIGVVLFATLVGFGYCSHGTLRADCR